MSQQMNFEEEQRGYHQASYTPTIEEGSGYQQQFATPPAQKVGVTYDGGSKSASAGQRLALAIVSVGALIGGLGILGGDTSNFFGTVIKLIGLIAVCFTIGIINLVFNGQRWRS